MKKVSTAILLLLSLILLFTVVKMRISQPIYTVSVSETVIITPAPSTPEPTAGASVPTPQPTPTLPSEPTAYTLSFIGDCTLWSNANYARHPAGFAGTIGEDYAYPFANTVQFFEDDDCTFANLECLLSDTDMQYDWTQVTFAFIAPTAYANIMLEGGVDFVTTANNHLMDCYERGRDVTYKTLEDYSIPYGQENQAQMFETESGLKIGIYTAGINMRPDWKTDEVLASIEALKQDGAELVVCMFHWSDELYYKPYDYQTKLAQACIDAGADVVYGSHPHCLQPVEEYNDGIILYSMGNWSFGGSTMPSDPDTAIAQLTFTREADGSLKRSDTTLIPCCVSSNLEGAESKAQNYNDYKPTPYPEDSEGYARVMAKLDGSFEPTSQGADYSAWWASRAG